MPGKLYKLTDHATIGGVLTAVTLFIGATVWASVAKSTTAWFWTNANISRGALSFVVLVLIIAVAVIIWLALALRRARTSVTPAGTLKVDSSKLKPEEFAWTPFRGYTLSVLLNRTRTDLDELYTLVEATGAEMPLMGKLQIARCMQAAERAGIVRIERLGSSRYYYDLTPHGHDWVRDKLTAVEHQKVEAHNLILLIDALPARSGEAIVALMNKWPKVLNLDEMHAAVTEGMRTKAPTLGVIKSEVAKDMEDLERLGLVRIDQTTDTMWTYALTTAARDAILDTRESAAKRLRERTKVTPTEAPKVDPKPAAAPAPLPEPQVPDNFNPTKLQAAAAAVLQRAFPDRLDLQDICSAMMRDNYALLQSGITKAEVASELEVLAGAHIVRIEWLSDNYAYYHLTKPGRAWLNERSARQRGRSTASRPSDY